MDITEQLRAAAADHAAARAARTAQLREARRQGRHPGRPLDREIRVGAYLQQTGGRTEGDLTPRQRGRVRRKDNHLHAARRGAVRTALGI